jgi:hypothetical protein
MIEAFMEYLEDTFGEEYDRNDVRHLTYLGIFEAGWEAKENSYD